MKTKVDAEINIKKSSAEKSMKIAADICIYTNDQITFEELSFEPAE